MRSMAQGGSSPARSGGIRSGDVRGKVIAVEDVLRGGGVEAVERGGVEAAAGQARVGVRGVATDAHLLQQRRGGVGLVGEEADRARDVGRR